MEFQKITGTNTCILVEGDDQANVVVPKYYEGMLVVEIAERAFDKFNNVKTILLPDEIRIINRHAFSKCKNLKKINLPTSIDTIPEFCFFLCSSLEKIQFHDQVRIIGKSAFFNCRFKVLTLPKNLIEIEEETFSCCEYLEEVFFPANLRIIKNKAFSYCIELKKITLPSSLELIEKFAFESSLEVKVDYLPNDFVDIEEEAFEIDLPKEVDPAYFKRNVSKNNHIDSNKSINPKIVAKATKNLIKSDIFLHTHSEALEILYEWLTSKQISNISIGEIYHSNFTEHKVGPYIFYYNDEKNLTFFRLPLLVDYTEKNIPYFKFDQDYFDEAVEEKFVVDYKEIKSSASRLFMQINEPLADKTTKFFTKKHLEKPSSLTKTYFYEYVFLNDLRYKKIFSNWEECRQNFLVSNADNFQGFSHLVKQHSTGSIQHKFDEDDLPMIGTINFISYSLVFNTLSMLENEKSNKKKPLRNTSSKTPKELIENPFLWTKLSVAERSKLDDKVLYPDTESIENYGLQTEFYGLDGDRNADILSDYGLVLSSPTYDDVIAEDKYLLEMEVNPTFRTGYLLVVFLYYNEKPHPSMYKYFQKYCYPKLKTPKDHQKYLSRLKDDVDGRLWFLIYLIALHPKEIFENELQLPNLFADYPQD